MCIQLNKVLLLPIIIFAVILLFSCAKQEDKTDSSNIDNKISENNESSNNRTNNGSNIDLDAMIQTLIAHSH